MEPERAEMEGYRAKVLLNGQLKKDGLMVRGAMRKDFGRG